MTVRLIAMAAFALTLLVPAAAGGSKADPAMLASIDALFTAANANDAAGVQAAYTSDGVIVDEFPPFHWSGPKAGTKWMSDFAAVSKQMGITTFHAAHGAPISLKSYGKMTYLVVPATLKYTAKGKAQTETGSYAFVVTKSGGAYKISTSAWATTHDSGE